jgi:hypothetical protein
MRRTFTAALACLLPLACSQEASRTTTLFRDITTTTGLPTATWSRDTEPRAILEVKGGGFGLLDFDGDGQLDVFLPGGKSLASETAGPGASLWRNTGGLAFEAADAGLDWHGWAMGVAVGDVDGNGFDDVFVAAHGPNALFLNQAGQRLDEAAELLGLADEAWGMAGALCDLDADGDLDLYVANYLELDLAALPPDITFQGEPVFAGPLGLTPAADRLYENLGDGHFKDKTFRSGLGITPPSFGLGVTALDFDEDGSLDLFVGNDSMANFLLRNEGQLRFEDVALAKGLAANGDGRRQATMGIAVADVNEDALPDLFTTNFAADTNTLFVSRRGRSWRDRTSIMGLTVAGQLEVGWACLFGDFDLDRDEDLVVFDGHVYPDRIASRLGSSAAQPALLFEREGARFTSSGASRAGAWLAAPRISRGGARADLDGDGDLELLVQEWRGPLVLLEGLAAESTSAWLQIELRHPGVGDRHGYGARIEVVEMYAEPRLRQLRTGWVQPSMGFQSSGTSAVHFALDPLATRRSMKVTWPAGHAQEVDLGGRTGRVVVEYL